MMTVVMGVTHPLGGHVQLCEGEQWDAGMLDSVNEPMLWQHRHRVDQFFWKTRRVGRQEDVGVQDEPLPHPHSRSVTHQFHITCGCHWWSVMVSFIINVSSKHKNNLKEKPLWRSGTSEFQQEMNKC